MSLTADPICESTPACHNGVVEMFTGIITELGTIPNPPVKEKDGWRVRIDAPLTSRGLAIGGSVAVDGVCLTAIDVRRGGFTVQVIAETARRSTFGTRRFARKKVPVNLERPLRASAEVGGHFVQGHVDAMARVLGLTAAPQEVVLTLELPASIAGLVVEKGSIAVNGVSLTVADVATDRVPHFTVALIPHTMEVTNLGNLKKGDDVNLEADILGKYIRALLPGTGRGRGVSR